MASQEARKQAIREASDIVRGRKSAFVSRAEPLCRPKPLIVTLYGGPGVGKSTLAAKVFAELKERGHEVEFVYEVAKGLTWEKRELALAHQPYIAAKQMFHMDRLNGQVDIIVTDTSTLLSLVYGENLTTAFKEWLVDDYKRRDTLNILLRRPLNVGYNPSGRNQTELEAIACDTRIEGMLYSNDIPYTVTRYGEPYFTYILDQIEAAL